MSEIDFDDAVALARDNGVKFANGTPKPGIFRRKLVAYTPEAWKFEFSRWREELTSSSSILPKAVALDIVTMDSAETPFPRASKLPPMYPTS